MMEEGLIFFGIAFGVCIPFLRVLAVWSDDDFDDLLRMA
jgi:hypothetical protein